MSQTPACPDVPDDVLALAMIAVAQLTPHCSDEADMDVIARAILADRASRALPSTALAARPEEGWKPIETAPKDGREIILFFPTYNENQIAVYRYNEDGELAWEGIGGWSDVEGEYAPTHWMPLPPAPSKPPTAGDGHD